MSPVTKNEWGTLADNARPRARAAVVYAASNAITHATMRTTRVDSGQMKGGWKAEDSNGGLKATVWNTQHYAIHHEHGTDHMTAIPMLAPALDAVEATFLLMLQQVFTPGLGGAS